uniref:Uncharacterized protein n=1 Tax=Setaria viridis TaxID=4556 RepID=A0A4V6D7L8_SETVI|nr:hypothetical protein SEVIR_5G462200v2 [Setaria viridis]
MTLVELPADPPHGLLGFLKTSAADCFGCNSTAFPKWKNKTERQDLRSSRGRIRVPRRYHFETCTDIETRYRIWCSRNQNTRLQAHSFTGVDVWWHDQVGNTDLFRARRRTVNFHPIPRGGTVSRRRSQSLSIR